MYTTVLYCNRYAKAWVAGDGSVYLYPSLVRVGFTVQIYHGSFALEAVGEHSHGCLVLVEPRDVVSNLTAKKKVRDWLVY